MGESSGCFSGKKKKGTLSRGSLRSKGMKEGSVSGELHILKFYVAQAWSGRRGSIYDMVGEGEGARSQETGFIRPKILSSKQWGTMEGCKAEEKCDETCILER